MEIQALFAINTIIENIFSETVQRKDVPSFIKQTKQILSQFSSESFAMRRFSGSQTEKDLYAGDLPPYFNTVQDAYCYYTSALLYGILAFDDEQFAMSVTTVLRAFDHNEDRRDDNINLN